MRRALILLALTGCGGFDLDATVRARPGTGQLKIGGVGADRFHASYFFGSYVEALQAPPVLTVTDGTGRHTFPLRVEICGTEEDWDRANLEYDLFYADGVLSLSSNGGSCIAGDHSRSVIF